MQCGRLKAEIYMIQLLCQRVYRHSLHIYALQVACLCFYSVDMVVCLSSPLAQAEPVLTNDNLYFTNDADDDADAEAGAEAEAEAGAEALCADVI